MAFVNERFTQEDKEKLNIEQLLDYFRYRGSDWTADHEREMYLLCVDNDIGPHGNGKPEWIFIWHGSFLWLQIKIIESKVIHDDGRWVHYKVISFGIFDKSNGRLFPARPLSEEINNQKDLVFNHLKEALIAYKGGGIFSTLTNFDATLDVELGGGYSIRI